MLPEDGDRTSRDVLEDLRDRAEARGDAKRVADLEAELSCGPFPKPVGYLWRAFWRLRRRKGGSGFGLSPIEWPDIDAFVRNARVALVPWEIELIEDLDDLYLVARGKVSDGSEDET